LLYTNHFLLAVSVNCCDFLLCDTSSLERSHSVHEAPLRPLYYVCRRIWNFVRYLIYLGLIVGSISVTLPTASRCRVSAWIYSGVVLICFKVPSKYLTGVAEERHDNPIAMDIVVVDEILYPYPNVHINIKYVHSLCIPSRDMSTASSEARSPPSVS